MKDIVLKIKTFFHDKAQPKIAAFMGKLSGLGRSAGAAGKVVGGLSGAFDLLGGSLGKVAGRIGGVIGAMAQLGPVGAVLAGINVAAGWIGERFQHAADKAVDLARAIGDGIRSKLESLKDAQLKEVADALDEATTKAQRAQKAFDAVANAYLKIARAMDSVDDAQGDLDLARLGAEREHALGMSDPGKAASGAAFIDVKIAERRLKLATDKAAMANMEAARQAEDDAKREESARAALRKAEDALAKAREAAALTEDATDLEEQHKKNLANVARAEEALANATNALAAAESQATASAEAVKATRLKGEASVTNARTAVESAKRTAKQVAKAQEKALDEAAKKIERKEADARIKAVKKAHDEQMAALDQEIDKARRLAAEWDAAAANANGKTFGEWNRGERDAAREKAKADRRQANAVKNAQSRLDEIMGRRRLNGKFANDWDAKRAGELQRFIQLNNPNGNAAKQRVENLEKRRLDLMKGLGDKLDAIKEELKTATEV